MITFATFRSTVPPPENTRFGAVSEPGMRAACTNPAALSEGRSGGSGGTGGSSGSGALTPYFQTGGSATVGQRGADSWAEGRTIETPWVTTPGLLTAQCTSNEHADYLEITVHADPSDPRTDDISGDLTPDWGLHLVDVPLTQGNLIEIVERQGAVWTDARR